MTAASNNVPPGELIRDHLLPVNKIPAETRRRLSAREFKTVPKSKVEEAEQDGWVVDGELKTRTRVSKAKRHDVAFEDRVWAAFARLQFTQPEPRAIVETAVRQRLEPVAADRRLRG